VVIPNGETDAALIQKAQDGDRGAYGELVRQHHQGVIQVVYRMCGDGELAEDAAQEAFIRAWTHLADFRPGTSLRNWLYRIATNAALDVLRREAKIADLALENLSLQDRHSGPEAVFLQKENQVTVQQAIMALTEASRSVLVLREYGGLSYQEIASALDIPLGTVMSRLNYARHRLQQTLQAHFIQMEMEHG
jgi:RNA polymerase sigma-70 factor (ECF subfamily)